MCRTTHSLCLTLLLALHGRLIGAIVSLGFIISRFANVPLHRQHWCVFRKSGKKLLKLCPFFTGRKTEAQWHQVKHIKCFLCARTFSFIWQPIEQMTSNTALDRKPRLVPWKNFWDPYLVTAGSQSRAPSHGTSLCLLARAGMLQWGPPLPGAGGMVSWCLSLCAWLVMVFQVAVA